MTATQTVGETIRLKLTAAFAPEHLDVIDESEQHRGHGGWREGGETHFRVAMRAAAFDEMSRVERSRAVYAALSEELRDKVHALALELKGSD
ncbi:MAG: BolA family transcriptional regulator [Rhodobacteraceae bacterium]|nr:BolA family transcriptional regulator [Paracoccaceae bacterium]